VKSIPLLLLLALLRCNYCIDSFCCCFVLPKICDSIANRQRDQVH